MQNVADMMNYAGKTVIITGSSGAIGQSLVDTFARGGANVVGVTRQPRDGLASPGAGEIVQIAADVNDRGAVEAMAAEAFDRFGRIDVLINNAGAQVEPKRFLDMTTDSFDWEISLNIYGPLHCCHIVGKIMRDQRSGNIINISSIASLKGGSGRYSPIYAGSKGFMNALTKVLAYDLAEYSIRVNTIAPGWIVPETGENLSPDSFWNRFGTEIFGSPEAFAQKFLDTGEIDFVPDQPLKRMGRPIDVAAAAYYLASGAAAHVTGQLLAIGGGDYMTS